MKNFFKICLAVIGGAFLAYAAYLVYLKFFKECDREEDDLYECDCEDIEFSSRVKKAAQRQLEKIG